MVPNARLAAQWIGHLLDDPEDQGSSTTTVIGFHQEETKGVEKGKWKDERKGPRKEEKGRKFILNNIFKKSTLNLRP